MRIFRVMTHNLFWDWEECTKFHEKSEGVCLFENAIGSGPDDLNPFMLQILVDLLAAPITALYNKSLQSGEVPEGFCPIFKKGGPEDATNYSPVSLTSVLCKIFENCSKRLCFCFLKRHDHFHRVSMDSFLVDPAYPTLSFRKNVLPFCWMKDTR